MKSQKQEPILIKPFNPNFISDFKGYILGMSPTEIDRLHSFRETGEYLNSKEDFQRVTQVSDSLLAAIDPYFKFPQWKTQTKRSAKKVNQSDADPDVVVSTVRLDLNHAKAEDLIRIRGVGKVLSERILKFRDALGGFLSDEQLNDVYGLDREVVQRILREFTVVSAPEIQPIDIHEASTDELARLVYISNQLAHRIVRFRDSVGELKSLEELTKIQDFPSDRFNRIKLYLTL